MNYTVAGYLLRRPEPADLELLHEYKNDPELAGMLGGFSLGYSMTDLREWMEFHRQRKDEVLWAIVAAESGICAGHLGLYQVDHRIRMAEFAILIGDRSAWGKGLGRACTSFALEYGFNELNLNRIHLSVLTTNERAIRMYRAVGFREEGVLRQAQFKNGRYVDVLLMSVLRKEYSSHALA
jgi:[ribosomal protein S5]-alanine N-acetyltransferase